MNQTVLPIDVELDEGPLYVAQKKLYPQSVHGTFRRIKWGLMAFCLGVYYLLPFVRWNRGLGAPNQAVLIDIPNSRFYFFFIELWPQGGLLLHRAVDPRRHHPVPDEFDRWPDLVRLSLPADGVDGSVLCRRASDRRRSPRAHEKRRRARHHEAAGVLRKSP